MDNSNESFFKKAMAHAISYRKNVLGLTNYSDKAYKLEDRDAEKGLNFIDNDIFNYVKERDSKGKGIGYERTTRNLLSSQAMCFNLFSPLRDDKGAAKELFNHLLDLNIEEILDVEIEYITPYEILHDNIGLSGVDCDVLVRYLRKDGKKGVITIETKYTEPDFSICGFKKSTNKDKCEPIAILSEDCSACRYKYKKGYLYWERTLESGAFDMDRILGNECPFGSSKWQLWVNTALSYGISRNEGYYEFNFIVVCPKGNSGLSKDGMIWDEFKVYLKKDVFHVLYLEDMINELQSIYIDKEWAIRFKEKYLFG